MTQGYNLSNSVKFVRASKNLSRLDLNEVAEQRSSKLTGEDAKSFYEDLLKTPSSHTPSSSKQRSKSIRKSHFKKEMKPSQDVLMKHSDASGSESSRAPTCADMFIAAENGDLENVKRILNSRIIDVNAADQFAWTSLMMAANKGHEHVVKHLLSYGAEWEDKVDGSGYDAFDLACLGGHPHIAHLLQHWREVSKREARQLAIERAHAVVKREKLWCSVCNVHYSATSDGDECNNEHARSIFHLFCNRRKEESLPPSSSFYLTRSNKGYRMLEGSGWDGNSGLGPASSGRKYPVKTVLKRDRFGIGCQETTARVTHFASGDSSAVFRPKKMKLKQVDVSREEKERKLAIDFRRSFY